MTLDSQPRRRSLRLSSTTSRLAVCLLTGALLFSPKNPAAFGRTADTFSSNTALTTGTNWSAGLPTAANDAIFNTVTGSLSLTSASLGMGSLNHIGTSSITISNQTTGGTSRTLTLGGGSGINEVSGAASSDLIYLANGTSLTIQGPNSSTGTGRLNMTLAASGSVNVANSGGTVTISSDIAGVGLGLNKTGAGLFILSGNNTYSGDTAVTAGTLRLGSTGAVTNSHLNLTGGTLELAAGDLTATLAASGAGTASFTSGTTTALSALGGTRTVTFNGGGTLTWGSTANFLTNETLSLSGATADSTLVLNNSLDLNGSTRAINVANAGNQLSGTVDGRISGSISGGAGALLLTGAGTLELTGTLSYTGATTIQAGALRVDTMARLANTNVALGNATAGGVLDLQGGVVDVNLGTTAGTVQFTNNNFSQGFSAHGSDLVLTLKTGVAGDKLTWNSTANFLGSTGGGLRLSHVDADATIELTNNIDLNNSSARTFTVDNGNGGIDARIAGVISNTGGDGGISKGGSGTLALTGLNTYTGTTLLTAGRLLITSIGDFSSGPSQLGSQATSALAQISLSGGGLLYNGDTDGSSNRVFRQTNTGASNTSAIISSGLGKLTLSGGITSATPTGTNAVNLGGYNTGDNVETGVIANRTGGTGSVALRKDGAGTWTLTGANTFDGGVTTTNGNLILDYSVNSTVLAPANILTLDGGTIAFKGNSGGTTSQSLASLSINNITYNKFVVNNNGGAGTTVTTGNTWTANGSSVYGIVLFDFTSGGTLKTTTAIPTGTASDTNVVRINNGILMGVASSAGLTNYRAPYLVQDSTGIGFASQNASNEIVRYTGATDLSTLGAGGASANTTNYFLISSLTRSAALTYSTLEFRTGDDTDSDPATGAITLDMATFGLNTPGASGGRALLVTGGNNVTIGGTGNTGSTNTVMLHNFGTGTTTFTVQLGSSGNAGPFIVGGPGLTVLTQPIFDDLYMEGGIVRLTGNQSAATSTGPFRAVSGGILEIGADLDTTNAASDFSRSIGSGAGQFLIYGNGGLSAFGGDRTVTLSDQNGTANGKLTWGSSFFLQNSAAYTASSSALTSDAIFILGSAKSDSKLKLTNPIELGAAVRVIQVNDGTSSTNIDGELSGTISGAGAELRKTGAGTLLLSGANTYNGRTVILGGKLAINAETGLGGTPTSFVGDQLLLDGGTLVTKATFAIDDARRGVKLGAGGGAFEPDSGTTLTLANVITGTGSLTKTGAGTATLSASNTYTGPTVVSAGTLAASATGAIGTSSSITVEVGGTLLLGGTGVDRIGSAVPLVLNGGTLSTAGLSNETEALGAFILSADSIIDFGAGTGDQLLFALLGDHTADESLSIVNWSGSAYELGGASSDRLIFTGLASDFSGLYDQDEVSFNGISGYQALQFGGQYEIVAIPEPSSTALLASALLVGLVGCREGRRKALKLKSAGRSRAVTA